MSSRGERSLSFDRVADRYDDTRGDPEEIDLSVAQLADAVLGARRCLEVGVGTGRIALPLSERGFDVVGVDLSRAMLDRLKGKANGTLPFPVVQADASRLCFADGVFDSAYAIWVLHLIAPWRRVLDEIARTLTPRGTVVIAFGGSFGKGPWQEITNGFRKLTGATNVGAHDIDEVDTWMAERGCEIRHLDELRVVHEVTPEEVLRRLDEATYSFTWTVEDAARTQAVTELRRWAVERYGDLQAPLPNEFGAAWRRYELPG